MWWRFWCQIWANAVTKMGVAVNMKLNLHNPQGNQCVFKRSEQSKRDLNCIDGPQLGHTAWHAICVARKPIALHWSEWFVYVRSKVPKDPPEQPKTLKAVQSFSSHLRPYKGHAKTIQKVKYHTNQMFM